MREAVYSNVRKLASADGHRILSLNGNQKERRIFATMAHQHYGTAFKLKISPPRTNEGYPGDG
jgi:hypothetical protein